MMELDAHISNSSVFPSTTEAEEMEFPVPADGLIYLHFPIKNNTEMLTLDVRLLLKNHISLFRQLIVEECIIGPTFTSGNSQSHTCSFCVQAYFEDSHNSLQLHRTYSSPSHSYLQIQKPPTTVQVNQRDSNQTKEPFYDSPVLSQVGSPVTLHIESNFPVSEIHYLVSNTVML